MANHKWKKDAGIEEYGSNHHTCTKCGIGKNWWGGDFQCWQYTWFVNGIAANGQPHYSLKESFKRPECVGKIIIKNGESTPILSAKDKTALQQACVSKSFYCFRDDFHGDKKCKHQCQQCKEEGLD